MKKTYLKILTVILLCWMTIEANAQEKPRWTIGVKGGWSYTGIARSNMGRVDETYSPLSGYDVGVQARCRLLDWLAIRVDLGFMSRSHKMDRNLPTMSTVTTIHHPRASKRD